MLVEITHMHKGWNVIVALVCGRRHAVAAVSVHWRRRGEVAHSEFFAAPFPSVNINRSILSGIDQMAASSQSEHPGVTNI